MTRHIPEKITRREIDFAIAAQQREKRTDRPKLEPRPCPVIASFVPTPKGWTPEINRHGWTQNDWEWLYTSQPYSSLLTVVILRRPGETRSVELGTAREADAWIEANTAKENTDAHRSA